MLQKSRSFALIIIADRLSLLFSLTIRLEYPPTAKLPVGLSIGTARLLADVVDARAGTCALLAVQLWQASPLATEINVGDNTLVLEVIGDITIRAGEIGQCFTPTAWVR